LDTTLDKTASSTSFSFEYPFLQIGTEPHLGLEELESGDDDLEDEISTEEADVYVSSTLSQQPFRYQAYNMLIPIATSENPLRTLESLLDDALTKEDDDELASALEDKGIETTNKFRREQEKDIYHLDLRNNNLIEFEDYEDAFTENISPDKEELVEHAKLEKDTLADAITELYQ